MQSEQECARRQYGAAQGRAGLAPRPEGEKGVALKNKAICK